MPSHPKAAELSALIATIGATMHTTWPGEAFD
jgi:hypothetical protein